MLRKISLTLFRLILSRQGYKTIIGRYNLSKYILTGDSDLRVFWKIIDIISSPVRMLISLTISLTKVFVVMVCGRTFYGSVAYAFNLFVNDMTAGMDVHLAIKRQKLFMELVVRGRERRISCGSKNPDKIFYVIRPYYYLELNELASSVHLLYNYYRNLQFIAYALDRKWIPVVDWRIQYGQMPHMEKYPVNGTENGWEYFWKQPSEYTLDEVYQSKNVILSVRNTIDTEFMPPCRYPKPFQRVAENYAKMCPQYDQLISFNDITAAYIAKEEEKLFPKGARIMGVSIRGTSYGSYESARFAGHPIQPNMEALIFSIRERMQEWQMDYIFFACESDAVVNVLRDTFGNKLLILPRLRYKGRLTPDIDHNSLYAQGHRYQTNLDYVTEMALLSRCTSLLASMSGGVRIAIIWNAKRYEKMEIIDNGVW